MGGVFRLSDQAALDALLALSHLRVHEQPRIVSPAGIRSPSYVHKRNGAAGSKVKKARKAGIDYNAVLFNQIVSAGLPTPEREYKFAADIGRKWRLDLAYPERKLAIEVESMAHRTRERFMADIEKYNELICARGWRLLRVYTRWITTEKREDTRALELVRKALEPTSPPSPKPA